MLGSGLESKTRACLEGNKRLGCSDELVNNNREEEKKKKKTISPRIYFETKGSKVSIVNALGCLASLSELSAQPHDELKAELRDREDKALLGSSYKEGACVLIK